MTGNEGWVWAAVVLLSLLFICGCLSTQTGTRNTNVTSAAPASTANYSYSTRALSYPAGNANISALLCEPQGADAKTPGIVLTGGDGVTAEKLRPVCEAFARKGFVALAHDNSGDGTIGGEIGAVVEGTRTLRADAPLRPVALWAHSAGTIFAVFAAYDTSVRPFAFIETSGHMQIPLCDNRETGQNAQCAAYLSEFPAPVMIVHGLNDTVVSASFAQMFAGRLMQNKIRYQALYVPDAKHEFMTDRQDVLEKETEFLLTYLPAQP